MLKYANQNSKKYKQIRAMLTLVTCHIVFISYRVVLYQIFLFKFDPLNIYAKTYKFKF